MTDPVTTAISAGIGCITLNRPDKFNCLSRAVHSTIQDAFETFESDGSVKSVLIRAEGENFCTGADLEEVTDVMADPAAIESFMSFGQLTMQRIEKSSLPVVVAVQGLCLAGGMELMLAADICFASEGARFGDQHSRFGLIPGWGASQRLPRLIGMRRALDLMYSGRWIDTAEAQRIGLINYVVAEDALIEEATKYCRDLTTRARSGLARMKRLAHEGMELTISDALRLETQTVVEHLRGEDALEGIAAFKERRKPSFR